ncbi:MAG: glycosyltransferase family 4 protein, partial [Actinobacteria bacterium]|nr:glycosyltransferase family 4 protein [Actinomycetota bacterium]
MVIGIESHFAEEEGSGNCTYTQNLIRQLAIIDKINDYVLYCTDRDFYFYKEISELNRKFRVVELKVKNKFLKIPFYLGYRTFEDRIDVIHTQYYTPLISKAKRVVTIHDIIPIIYPQFFNWFEVLKQKFFLPYFARKADRVITVSSNSKKDICKYLKVPEDKVVEIYNGVSNEFRLVDQNEKAKIIRKFEIRGPYIYYVGRLDPRKNLKNVIKAFAQVASRNQNVDLIIAGNKNEYFVELLGVVKEFNLGERVKFIGLISNEDNIRLLNFAEFFVYPSIYEGFGLPVLEAMACGCPVITSKGSSLGEISKGCALLVDPENVEEIRDAMITLLKNKFLRAELVGRGRERVKEFSWELTARKTLEVYESPGA